MEEIEITVMNELAAEKRDINVYHHYKRGAYLICYSSAIIIPLRIAAEDDYLHISITSGPGDLEKDCLIDLPAWVDFTFFSQGTMTAIHSGKRTILEIPPGPAVWQLKITRPRGLINAPPADRITIGDHLPENL